MTQNHDGKLYIQIYYIIIPRNFIKMEKVSMLHMTPSSNNIIRGTDKTLIK